MICRITGRVEHVGETTVQIATGAIWYELLVPAADIGAFERLRGEEVTLHTIQYLEGNPTASHFSPRLIGFVRPADRDFFRLFVKVRGISNKKALRAMSLPSHQLAAAIEGGDIALLTTLPEIGKKTAAQIVADLQGKLDLHLLRDAAPTPVRELSKAQQVALDILVQWGDRRADAQRWVTEVTERHPELEDPQEIVRAAYRVKQGAG